MSEAEKRALAGDIEALEDMRADVQARVNSAGVLSLSSLRDDALMWAHYANGHRGICLQFALDKWEFAHTGTLPVTYSPERPFLQINKVTFADLSIAKLIALTKSADWSYEEEWRLVDPWKSGEHPFPSEFLSGVIFGWKISKRDENRIRKWVAKRSVDTTLYRATEIRGKFRVQIQRI